MVYKNSFVVAENLAKFPSSSTRIPSRLQEFLLVYKNSFSSTRIPSWFTNRAPRHQLRDWEIIQTHNMIPGGLGNIYSLKKFFLVKIKWTEKKTT